jgi:hypothetical protein
LIALHGGPKLDPRTLTDRVEVAAVAASFELEKRVDEVFVRFGLTAKEESK